VSITDGVEEAGKGKETFIDVDELIGEYEAPNDTIMVELPKGEKFTFRAVRDHAEYQAIKARVANRCRKILNRQTSQSWNDRYGMFIPKSPVTIAYAAFLCEVQIEPRWDIGDWLKLARRLATLFDDIIQIYERQNSPSIAMNEMKVIEQLGEESEAMDFGEQSSSSQETPSESIQTI
jgi:hypothetical protein